MRRRVALNEMERFWQFMRRRRRSLRPGSVQIP